MNYFKTIHILSINLLSNVVIKVYNTKNYLEEILNCKNNLQ